MRLAPRVSFGKDVQLKCGGIWVRAKCEDISLFGVKLKFYDDERPCSSALVKVHLSIEGRRVLLVGKVVRREQDKAVVVFEEEEGVIANRLGRFFTKIVKNSGVCPFCKVGIEGDKATCSGCGMPIEFVDVHIVKALRRIRVGDIIMSYVGDGVEGSFHEEVEEFLWTSERMKDIYELIDIYSEKDESILIQGEPCTGRKSIARLIHKKGSGKGEPFVILDCRTIHGESVEKALRGRFEGGKQPCGGTLVLAGVDRLPAPLQKELVEIIDNGLGVRVVSTAGDDLDRLLEEGKFDRDLMERLGALRLRLPPLRERKEDIPSLANHFLKVFSKKLGKCVEDFTPEAMEIMVSYPWYGNICELMEVVREAVAMSQGKLIDVGDLNLELSGALKNWNFRGMLDLRGRVEKLERELVEKAFKITRGNISRMALMLGVSRPTVYKLLDKFQLS